MGESTSDGNRNGNGNGVASQPPLRYKRITSQPENPFSALIPHQSISIIPSFTLESGAVLHNVPVAYSTRGRLSPHGDNAMVICHALTGSADVADWWGPLLGGPGRAMDITRFYVVCINSLGSPYGTASPVTYKDGDPTLGRYGPEFPLTTIRDDVNLHKLLLDDLGINQIAVAIGGSMGGMLVLEWAYFGKDYIRAIVPIATSSQHSAWGISWGEAQRQSIYSDPKYEDGYYSFEDPPSTGLGAARMSALLTYRSRNSFEARFGRNAPDPSRQQTINGAPHSADHPTSTTTDHFAVHNDGHRTAGSLRPSSRNGAPIPPPPPPVVIDPQFSSTPQPLASTNAATPPLTASSSASSSRPHTPHRSASIPHFSAQSYLRYQGQKFVHRFDSNCYIAITRKLDTHDVSRHRPALVSPPPPSSSISAPLLSSSKPSVPPTSSSSSPPAPSSEAPAPSSVAASLALITQPTLVLGIESDGLFTFAEQQQLAAHIPHARLKTIDSPEGHDAFLLQFEQVNAYIIEFLKEVLPDFMAKEPEPAGSLALGTDGASDGVIGAGGAGADSSGGGGVTGEVDDITAW